MNRFVVFIIICLFLTISEYLPGESIGFSSGCINGKCSFAVGSSIYNIILALVFLLFITFYPQKESTKPYVNFGFVHKFIALLIDFVVTITIIAPFASIPLLLKEYSYTGTFHWEVYREFSRNTDSSYILLSLIFAIFGMYYYYQKHKKLKIPTIGQYVLSNIK